MSMTDRKQNQSKRNVGLQTIVATKEYVPPAVAVTHNLETEEYPKFVAIPRSIAALIILCGVIFYLSRKEVLTVEEGLKNGIIGIIISIIFFGCLFLPDSFLRRPHPTFWRLVTSAALIYLLFAMIVLFQSKENARQLLTFFDKDLGKPLPEKSYAEHCSITQKEYPYLNLEHVWASIDMYMIAHLLGWYVKMLIVRNVKLCWFLSILFEILEITFRHWLPNFWECWWDHALLDVFGMNALGIWLGDLTCRLCEMKNYKWINRTTNESKAKTSSTVYTKLSNFASYFTPNFYVKHEWDLLSSTKRFFQVTWFFVFMNLVDLSHFFLKFVLWIPQTHDILAARIYMWGLLAMISAREYYEYITNPTCKRFGVNVWLAHLIVLVEWSIVIKLSDGLFTAPFPNYVVYFWTVVFLIISGITIHLVVKDFLKYFKKGIREKKVDLVEPEIEIEYLN